MSRLVFAVLVSMLLIWGLALAPKGFFSGDSGVKFAQAHALWESGFKTRALPYNRELDPSDEYFPYRKEIFTRVSDGERHGIYSVVFATLAAPLVGLWGTQGLPILPLAGSMGTILAMLLIGRRLKLRLEIVAVAIVVTVFATPLLLYSVQFSEHSIVVGLSTFALALIAPRGRIRPGWAGVCAGLAGAMRPEAYCVVAAVGLALVSLPHRQWRERILNGAFYLVGALAVLLPYWLVNSATSGTWDLAVATNAKESIDHQAGALVMLVGHIKNGSILGWGLPFGVAAAVGCIPPPSLKREARLAVHIPVAVALCVVGWRAQSLASGPTLAGIFCVTPVAGLGLLVGPWPERSRHLWVFALAFALQVLFLERTGEAGGLQFGARYLLPALPPLLLLASVRLAEIASQLHARSTWQLHRISLGVASILVALSIAGMARGVGKPLKIARDGATAATVASQWSADIVVTQLWWQSQVLAPVSLADKELYFANGPLWKFLDHAVEDGHRRAIVVADEPMNTRLSNGYFAKTVERVPGWIPLQGVELRRPRPEGGDGPGDH